MRYSLQVEVAARAQIRKAVRWYREHAPWVVRRFIAVMLAAQQQLIEAPLLWAEIEPGVRRLLVEGFPCALVYRVEGDQVTVACVVHQRRHPGAWRVTGPCGG